MSFRTQQEKIYFSGKTAQSFGIIDRAPKAKKSSYEALVEKIEENEAQVKLFLKVTDPARKEFKKELIISKSTLSKKEATIIGWCYATLISLDPKHRTSARHYLKEAIKNDGGGVFDDEKPQSALPYYLLSSNNLFEATDPVLRYLYRARNCADVSPNYMWELFRAEKDNIRKKEIATWTLKQFPKADNEYFIDFLVNELIKKGKLKDARKLFESQLAKIAKKDWDNGYSHLKITIVNLLMAQKDFLRAEKMLGGAIFSKASDNLLKGKFYFEKGDYQKAISCFSNCISSTITDTDDTQASYYYLLACYAKTKNIPEIRDIIENAKLCHQELVVYYPLDFAYGDFAEKTLKDVLKLKLDELLKAKVRGLLAYIQTSSLPVSEDEKPVRALTASEKKTLKEAEATIRGVLEYYPNDKLFNATYSNILFFKKDYDNALRYKLRAIEGLESSLMFLSLQVKMRDATESFLDGYSGVVKDAVENYGVDIADYIEHQFNEDAGALYEKRKFTAIKDLYEYIKPNINNLEALGKSDYYGTWNIGLFELGYALGECGDEKEAKSVYEAYLKSHPDASSALNNLAIIYEKEKNIDKAKKLIRKAKEQAKDDELIGRNYNRIFSDSNKSTVTNQPKQQVQEKADEKTPQTVSKGGIGYLLLNGGEIEVGPSKNIPFKLLEALCPLGTVKGTNAIFNLSSSDRSKFKDVSLSLLQKQDILRTRIKELQETLRRKKVKVSLVFNEGDETILLRLAKR